MDVSVGSKTKETRDLKISRSSVFAFIKLYYSNETVTTFNSMLTATGELNVSISISFFVHIIFESRDM